MALVIDPASEPYGARPNDPHVEFGPVWDAMMRDALAAGGATIELGSNTFYTARTPIETADGALAQLPLPWNPNDRAKIRITIRGAERALVTTYGQSGVQEITGGGIVSLLTGGATTGGRVASLIGGPRTADGQDTGHDQPVSRFTNLQVRLRDCTIRCQDDPPLTALDLSGVQQAHLDNVTVDVPHSYGATLTVPTHPSAFGIILPTVNNNALAVVRDSTVLGYFTNLAFNEHADVSAVTLGNGRVALAPWGPLAHHSSRFAYVSVENHLHVLAPVDPRSGVASRVPGRFVLSADNIDIEDAGGPFSAFAAVDHIHDGAGHLFGRFGYVRIVGNVGAVNGLRIAGPTNLRTSDLGATRFAVPADGAPELAFDEDQVSVTAAMDDTPAGSVATGCSTTMIKIRIDDHQLMITGCGASGDPEVSLLDAAGTSLATGAFTSIPGAIHQVRLTRETDGTTLSVDDVPTAHGPALPPFRAVGDDHTPSAAMHRSSM